MRLRRLATPLLVALLALGAAFAPPLRASNPSEAQIAFAALPDSNPYRALLLRYAELPEEQRKLLNAWVSPSGAEDSAAPAELPRELRAFAAEMSAGLRAAASAPPLTAAEWPILPNPSDPENPAAIIIPGVGLLRELGRIATRHADDLPPAEAVDAYAAVAQLGRQQRVGSTLIGQLTGVAIEGIAQAGLARRLGEFSADDLRRLSAAWLALAPPPDHADAFAGERDLFFKPIVENLLLPGLREMIASGATAEQLFAASAEQPSADFARDLRLGGLADFGGGERMIMLENTRDASSFTLRLGARVDGIELVSLDFGRRLAVIRRGTDEAVINLESKRIVPRKSAATRLREFFSGNLNVGDQTDFHHATLAALLARARAHPEGPEGYARELLAAYQAGIDRQIAAASSARYPNPEPTEAEKSDPLLKLVMPAFGNIVRTFNGLATSNVMLEAAIQHRLGQLGETAPVPVPDPWAKTSDDTPRPFQTERLPDGAFLLRSAYEIAPGAPYTYKFAAPDAGFIRVKPKP
jgi:hypothetical protein